MLCGMFVYPWDIQDEGAAEVAKRLVGAGLNAVSVATAYHAGKFLRPHGPNGRVIFPEDGTVYFRPDSSRYGRLQPQAARMVADHDALASLAGKAPDLHVTAWTVGLHNSRLGAIHPDIACQTPFGDVLVNALCPSQPEVRRYLVALCLDTAAQPGVREIAIETPGFQTYRHGHHHEFELIDLPPAAETLLATCFCPACLARGREAGLDGQALAAQARQALDAFFADEAATLPDPQVDADWVAWHTLRANTVTSLIAEIRASLSRDIVLSVIPSVQTPNSLSWREGSDLAALAGAADRLDVTAYQHGPQAIGKDIAEVRAMAGPNARLGYILRPTWPHVSGAAELATCVAAARSAVADRISFYNYGHVRLRSLDWIAAAL
ncbi:MAG: hypothetical protein ACK4L4_19000 [Gemmobacter sp.]